MPPGFTTSYARLDGLCRIRVKPRPSDGERVLPGHAYIAPGGTAPVSVERSGANYIARVRDGEPVNRHKPSVEVLFKSAARVVGPNAVGIMLTGMGADGARAMRAMRDAGSYNICQDEASCVVFGMPREAIRAPRRSAGGSHFNWACAFMYSMALALAFSAAMRSASRLAVSTSISLARNAF
jgi:two-component system chemotaxis response regulator CheB